MTTRINTRLDSNFFLLDVLLLLLVAHAGRGIGGGDARYLLELLFGVDVALGRLHLTREALGSLGRLLHLTREIVGARKRRLRRY